MKYRLQIINVLRLSIRRVFLLACCVTMANAVAQSPQDIERQVEAEVNSLLAEIESSTNQEPSTKQESSTNQKSSANNKTLTKSVYNPESKRRIADVAVDHKYSIVENQGNWLLVRYEQAVIPGWVSQDYVTVRNGVATITASVLNLRSQASGKSLIIDQLARGYSSIILDRKSGFFKVLAPNSLIVAIKKTEGPAGGSWDTNVNVPSSKGLSSPVKKVGLKAFDVNRQDPNIESASSKASINNLEIATSVSKPEIEKSHIIAAGDAISLLVFGESDLSIENVRVPQGGQVSLPLIGAVTVAGKTTSEVERDIYSLLSQGYVRNPRLSVSIFSYRPIFIRGAVKQTGSFPFTEGLTVAKAIALAGGSKNSASKQGVSILRDGNVVLDSLTIDSQVKVSSGDVISIAEEFGVSEDEATYVYLHGEVVTPGEYLFRRGLTVEKAVVLAGGFTLRASRKKVSVTRYSNKAEGEEPEKFKKVRLYTPVQPGDIIDVGASWF